MIALRCQLSRHVIETVKMGIKKEAMMFAGFHYWFWHHNWDNGDNFGVVHSSSEAFIPKNNLMRHVNSWSRTYLGYYEKVNVRFETNFI